MKEIARRDKSTNSIEAIENKKCLLNQLPAAAFSVSIQRLRENAAMEAMKFLPEITPAGLDLNSSTSYVTDIRCVAAAVPERTPKAGQAAALPDP
ncbi:hypothetical protein [Rhizobium leguminosarum]|uniref:hypothetical protein n=1 Tax=Rhizobium leguminosarum TaxID=384 RepID=UPI001AE9755B|nr:hypothetical protein [Rhizobium leguminosarum]MBP2449306.1 hypothetical protein [Rhizobium leguminosarum]